MNKNQLSQRLSSQYQQFADFINGLSNEQFTAAPTGKWTAGQQLDHLIRSVAPLNKVMQTRAIVESFGKAKQPSRDYDGVVAFYKEALAKGGKASGQFVPEIVTSEQKKDRISKLMAEVDTLCKLLQGYSEEDIDELVIPHPLLGNLTMREMMHFTTYHGSHHEVGIRKAFE